MNLVRRRPGNLGFDILRDSIREILNLVNNKGADQHAHMRS